MNNNFWADLKSELGSGLKRSQSQLKLNPLPAVLNIWARQLRRKDNVLTKQHDKNLKKMEAQIKKDYPGIYLYN
ncbi:MAG: hypothetical protein EBZ49_00475 [Proteobacteria bacterium]|nr:hypothetical protein [Pseudomonadota bacterium]